MVKDLTSKFTTDSEWLLGIPVGLRVNGDEHWKRQIQKMSSKIAPWGKKKPILFWKSSHFEKVKVYHNYYTQWK